MTGGNQFALISGSTKFWILIIIWYWQTVLFLWRYEPVRHTGKSDDWLTIFFARIIRLTVQKFQLFWVIFCIIIFFIESWHILILWLAKMPNGGMPVFTLIATGCTEASNQKSKYVYRKIFFYEKALHDTSVYASSPKWLIICRVRP